MRATPKTPSSLLVVPGDGAAVGGLSLGVAGRHAGGLPAAGGHQDGELPFGHPGRRFDDTPEGFEPSPLVDQGPERDYTPDEYGRVIHYGPRDRPLCGNDSVTAVYTDDPALVSGCRDCLELVAEDPGDDNEYMGHCLHCRREITAQGGVEWRRVAPRALLLRRRPLQVKRQQPPQDVLVFQIHRPAIRSRHRRVQSLVSVVQPSWADIVKVG